MAKKDTTKPKASNALAETKREPNAAELTAIARAEETRAARPARVAFNEKPSGEEGNLVLDAPHNDLDGHVSLVMETLASRSNGFVDASLLQLARATRDGGKHSVSALNASLAFIGAVAPNDEFEAALAVQMAATHDLAMEMLARTKAATRIDGMREYGTLATKLSRTFAAQMKALSDWRRGGEQVVRHVHVYEGGQAVVAETVNIGDRNNGNDAFNPHAQGANVASMLGDHSAGNTLPGASDEGAHPLPNARGQDNGRWRTER